MHYIADARGRYLDLERHYTTDQVNRERASIYRRQVAKGYMSTHALETRLLEGKVPVPSLVGLAQRRRRALLYGRRIDWLAAP